LVNADLARDWNVEVLAEAAGVSCPHLHHIVRERFGVSPMKLVTRLRMERAQEWLIIYDAPQRVIGEMVGYQNEFAFLVAFKRFSGVTPKEFRKWR
jgi:AraC-like DNA-binding protein